MLRIYPQKIYLNMNARSDVNGEVNNGVTILYFPQTMIDDGIYGSVGIMLTKDKKPEYILGTFFSGRHRK